MNGEQALDVFHGSRKNGQQLGMITEGGEECKLVVAERAIETKNILGAHSLWMLMLRSMRAASSQDTLSPT